MYYLFRYHHWEPQKYESMGYGARKVIASFVAHEIEEKIQEAEEVRKNVQ